jgi:undecaprenyl-diphosphatase
LQRGIEGDFVENISYKKCLFIGLFQSIAMIPGVSRSAATILGGLFLGIKRQTIVEFSFLLAVPTMLAATGLDLIKSANQFSLGQWNFLAVGFFVSFVVAILSIKFLLSFVKKRSFISFGIYRIIIAVVFFALFIIN